MAVTNNAKLPNVFFFLFFLIVLFHTTMARNQQSFQTLGGPHDTSRRGKSIRKSTVEHSTRVSSNKVDYPFAHESSRSRVRRRKSKRQEEVFNAGDHEVPSGPNPISNR